MVLHVLAGYYVRQRFSPGQPIAFEQVAGEVGGVGGVNTVIETAQGTVVLPNAMLLESVVASPQTPAAPDAQSGD